jgi:alkylhydroperoxidase family enzyme
MCSIWEATMARIKPVEYEYAETPVKKEFEDQIQKHGRITNMKRTLLHSLPAFHALMEWYSLRTELLKFIKEREFNLFSYSISEQNNCLICSTFFRKILIDNGDNPDEPNLTERESILIDFGRRCVSRPNDVDDALYERLKKYFSDAEIVVLTAFAGLMIATNLINNVLKVDLDEYLVTYTKR